MKWGRTPWYYWLPVWFGLIVLGLLVLALVLTRYIAEHIG